MDQKNVGKKIIVPIIIAVIVIASLAGGIIAAVSKIDVSMGERRNALFNVLLSKKRF